MLPIIESLLVLQERDERLDQIRSELARIPQEAATIENQWNTLCSTLQALENEVRQAEVERKKLNLEATATKEKIAKYKAQQQQTRKNEEYQALIHEIAHGEKKLSELEDQELAMMEKVAQKEQQVVAARADLKIKEKEIQTRRDDLKKKKEALDEQLTTVLADQQEAETKVEESILKRYRRILGSKKTKAVVGVTHGVCGGCHMKLTTQNALLIKGGREITSCDNCGRLTYWNE